MNRSSILVRLARAFQLLPLGFLRIFEKPIVILSSRKKEMAPLVFVLALPRSGSTIAYQALVHATKPLYLSNVWNLLYFVPLIGGRLSRIRCHGYHSDFKSAQGFVHGLCGPAEGLKFWSYWLGHCLDETENERAMAAATARDRPEYLRMAFSGLGRPGEAIVSGYIGHCLVVQDLIEKFPRAVFVRLTRDRIDNALSILRIRLQDPDSPFSVTPRELSALGDATIHQQIAAQVWFLNARLDMTIDPRRTVTVSYDELCEDPSAVVGRITGFCAAQGIPLAVKRSLPERFTRRGDVEGEDWEWHAGQLAAEFSRLDSLAGARGGEVFPRPS